MELIINGQTPSKKNSKQLFRNKKTGKMFIASQGLHLKWEPVAVLQVNSWKNINHVRMFSQPIQIRFFFYRKDRRAFDYVNVCQAPLDVLVKCGIIEDDDMNHVTPIFDGWAIDKEHPRCKITFTFPSN